MKIAVLADIHANLPALESVLAEAGDMPKFCCGDLVGYNPFPNEVIGLAAEKNIVSILGNHDHAVLSGDTSGFNSTAKFAIEWTKDELTRENLNFLKQLPMVYDNEIYMSHGSPKEVLEEYVYEDDPDYVFLDFFNYTKNNIIVLGHTHVPFVKRVDEKLIFNPGSAGQPRDLDCRASFAVLDTETLDVEIKRVDYDIERTAKRIEEEGLPGRLAMRLFRGV
jgi:putative phosphoesterase